MHILRLSLALAACLSLTSCSLINTALRMAPYLLLFADENPAKTTDMQQQQRGLEVRQRGLFAPQQKGSPTDGTRMAAVAAH